MDFIELNYESKRHAMAERFSIGNGRTACGLWIENGITGVTAYVQTIDCERCQRILAKEK